MIVPLKERIMQLRVTNGGSPMSPSDNNEEEPQQSDYVYDDYYYDET